MALLAVAVVVLVLSLATGRLVGAAAVAGLLTGCLAARLVHDELVLTRREAAHDRARQAAAYRQLAARSAVDHARFVAATSRQAEQREARLDRVRGALRIALRRAEAARKRADGLQARVDSLEESLDTILESPSVAELVGWDRRAAEQVGAPDLRRHA